jgi:hypothetical protein
MQAYVLILTVLCLTPDIRSTTKMQEFGSFLTCMKAGQEARNAIIEQAKEEGLLHIPRVKAVCLPK